MTDYVINLKFLSLDKFKYVVDGMKTALNDSLKLNKVVKDVGDDFKDMNKNISKLSSLPGLGFVDDFVKFGDKSNELKDVFTKLGGNFTSVMGNFKKSIHATGIAFKGLMTKMLPFLPLIIGIGVAIFTLKRVWMQNIGGMQNKFFEVVGRLKDMWAKFMIIFDKTLRDLAPLFNIVFSVLSNAIKPILTSFEILINIFNRLTKTQKLLIGTIIGVTIALYALTAVPIVTAIVLTLAVIGKLPKALQIVTVSVIALSVALWLLVANPIVLKIVAIIAVVVALGVAIYKLVQYMYKFRKVLLYLIPGYATFKLLQKGVQLLIPSISGVMDRVKNLGKRFLELGAVQKTLKFIKDEFGFMLKPISYVFDKLKGMYDMLIKIRDFFVKKIVGEKTESNNINRDERIKTSSDIIGGKNTTVNDNRAITVNSASEISPQNAVGIVEAVGGDINKYTV